MAHPKHVLDSVLVMVCIVCTLYTITITSTLINTLVNTNTHTHMHTNKHTHTRTQTQTHTNTCAHYKHTHTYMHVQTDTFRWYCDVGKWCRFCDNFVQDDAEAVHVTFHGDRWHRFPQVFRRCPQHVWER